MKIRLSFIFLWFSIAAFAQNDSLSLVPRLKQKGFLQADFLSVKMPNGEKNIGLTGIHYNLNINQTFYAGLGYYGAISGLRGGFFTLGLKAGMHTYINKNLFVDAGVYFGGGGGADAPDGGGAVVLPHVNIGYQFPKFALTAGYSYVNFFDGGLIKSSQLNYAIRIPFQLKYAPFNHIEKKVAYKDYQNSEWNTPSKGVSFTLRLSRLSPKKESQDILGNSLVGNPIQLVGFELSSDIVKNGFLFARADGAYKGIPGGYLNVLVGYGHRFLFFNEHTALSLKFGLGPGGGGGVDTEGGLLLYPDISLSQKLWKNLHLTLNKGLLMTPNQHFFGSSFGFGLQYNLHQNGFGDGKDKHFDEGVFKGLEIIGGQELYFNAKRQVNPTENLHQVFTQINFFLKKQWYVATHVSFANFGNAGAYGEGTFGLGVTTPDPQHSRLKAFAQVMLGGSGGGNISVGQGLIVKPSVGLQYRLHPVLDLRTAFGHVKALDGDLSSSLLNLGITYRIALLQGKK